MKTRFRAWDEEEKAMLYNPTVSELGLTEVVRVNDIFIYSTLMQDTGKTDVNGFSIYEGDIVNIMDIWEDGRIIMSNENPFVVKFGEFWNGEEYDDCIAGNGWHIERLKNKTVINIETQSVEDCLDHRIYSLYSGKPYMQIYYEIIGNIYENPELLN